MKKTVRTRFAVSPTGFMHVGGVRNALFDWLVAKQGSGQFILRIEDTDQNREVPGAVDHIKETLEWLNLNPDETYVQSQRLKIYLEWAKKLLDSGRAYADPYSPDEIQKLRDRSNAEKKPFLFREYRPQHPPKWDGTQPLRFKSEPKTQTWQDEVMGELHAGAEAVDDFIIIKSDGFPTYNFCHIIDDHLMDITHVIRSQEFISSMPRFLNLYEALGFDLPIFAHLPWIMAPDGKRKLSKRDGARDVLNYASEGYLPEALLNFLASLGWNNGTEQEIFSVDELINKFSLKQVQKSGASFDEQRLTWMNGVYIRKLSLDELYRRSTNFWPDSAKDYPDEYKKKVLSIIQERLKYLSEIPTLTSFFFEDLKMNPDLIKKDKRLGDIAADQLKDWLTKVRDSLSQSDFGLDDISKRLNELLAQTGQKPAVLFSLVRIAITQTESSPGLFETIEVLGKDKVLARINKQIEAL